MEDLTGQVDTVDSITAAEWNNLNQEFKNLITLFFAMSVGDLNQLRKAIGNLVHQADFYVDSGGANAYILSPIGSIPGLTAHANGAIVRFRPLVANTGASTIAVNGLAAKTLTREDGTALQANDIVTTRDAFARYNLATDTYRLFNFALGAPAQALPNGFIRGLTMGRNLSEPVAEFRDIAVQVGSCRDTTNTANLVNNSILVKRFDATFAKGSAVGGFPAALGVRTVSTWYRFFVVGRVNGEFEAGFDTSATAANLLAALNTIDGAAQWPYYRQIGWVRTTAGSNIDLVPFVNDPSAPEEFVWSGGDGAIDWDRGSSYGGSGLQALEVVTLDFAPPDSSAVVEVLGFTQANSASSGMAAIVKPTTHPDIVPSRTLCTVYGNNIGPNAGLGSSPASANAIGTLGRVVVRVDASRQCNFRAFTIGSSFYPFMNTMGFFFER